MSDFVAIESIKDALAECPICTEYFNDTSRVPRRMPCCLQAMCEPCLETYSQGRRSLSCPLCRQHHNLPGGVKSLPKEMLILRFLDVLKTQSNAVPSCTDCPDNNTAMARCDTCSIYLCQPCLAAHSRNRMSRDHKTTTFEEIKSLRSSRFSKPVTQHKSEYSSQVNQKLESTVERIQILTAIGNNLDLSKKRTSEQINIYFDDLIAELQQRRVMLLSEADSKADKEHKSIMRSLESNKTFQHQLQKAANGDMMQSDVQRLLNHSPEDVKYNRRGVSFMEDNKQQLTSIIRKTGLIRTITFMPTEDVTGPCDFILLENDQTRKATDVTLELLSEERKENTCSLSDKLLLPNNPILCPDIKFDSSVSNDEITISGLVVQNIRPTSVPDRSGCRLQSRRAFFSKPFLFSDKQRLLYLVKVGFTLKQIIKPGYMIWEVTSNTKHLDRNFSQKNCFEVSISTSQYEYTDGMCLSIAYDSILQYRCRIAQNKAGARHDLQIAVLVDSENSKIHVIDVDSVQLLATVSVSFNEPVWTSMYIGREINSELKVELLSGNYVHLSRDMMELLCTL